MYLSDLTIILCRPGESGNVGAVCRAMKNMGLSRLRLVIPEIPAGSEAQGKPLDDKEIRVRAVHGEDVWEAARIFPSLEAAAADCSLIIGTTRRRGHRRKGLTLTPEEAAVCLRDHPGPAALVFGNERTGLDHRELALCNMASHIPSDETFPSLNLSHAVQIYTYSLFRTLLLKPAAEAKTDAPERRYISSQWTPMDQPAIDHLVSFITGNLARLGCYKQPGREEQERFLRDLCARAGLTTGEGRYLGNIFARATRLAEKAAGKEQPHPGPDSGEVHLKSR
jgi:tRNA/rRNA methyltransferase/tRNA (cytidine32/uridine32-2'-O)-methyltransferase